MCTFPGAARVSEEVEEVEADTAPPQSAQAAPRLHQPQRVSSHAGLPAALLARQPDDQRTPAGYRGDVIQAPSLTLLVDTQRDGSWLSPDSQLVQLLIEWYCQMNILMHR